MTEIATLTQNLESTQQKTDPQPSVRAAAAHNESVSAASNHKATPAPFPTEAMTPEEFAALPDDENRYEYINGEARAMSPAGGHHGGIATRLIVLLGNALMPTDHIFDFSTGYRLPGGNVLSPDVSVILAGRLPGEEEPVGFVEVAPDLAVEIASPSDPYTYLQEKTRAYLDWGVKAVWIVDPELRQVMVHTAEQIVRVHGEESLDGGDAVPNFRADLADVFPVQRTQSPITNP